MTDRALGSHRWVTSWARPETPACVRHAIIQVLDTRRIDVYESNAIALRCDKVAQIWL